jgi:hypothetical protein
LTGKSFWQGGLTRRQVLTLFEHAADEKYSEMKFLAGIHGVDLDKKVSRHRRSKSDWQSYYEPTKGRENLFFKHPDEYAAMSKEEKEALTRKMMGPLKQWAGGALDTQEPVSKSL